MQKEVRLRARTSTYSSLMLVSIKYFSLRFIFIGRNRLRPFVGFGSLHFDYPSNCGKDESANTF